MLRAGRIAFKDLGYIHGARHFAILYEFSIGVYRTSVAEAAVSVAHYELPQLFGAADLVGGDTRGTGFRVHQS